MTQPTSKLNSQGQALDIIVDSAGNVRLKLAVGSKAVSGLTDLAAWHGVATHAEGATFAGSDGLVAIGGVDGTDTVQRVLADAAGRLQVSSLASVGSLTDRSGSITSGGSSQQLAAANASRKYLFIQNVDASETMWINFGTAAVQDQPSIKLVAGASFDMERSFISTEAVHIIATTTGHKFTAKEG